MGMLSSKYSILSTLNKSNAPYATKPIEHIQYNNKNIEWYAVHIEWYVQ